MRTLTENEMNEIVDCLQGTCMSLEEGLRVLDDENVECLNDIQNEMQFYSFIDERIFLCSKCGWWCEAGDWIDDTHPNWDPCEETCSQCGDD